MSNLNFDSFEIKPQFWFGDRVSAIDEEQTSEGTIRGLDYVLHDYAAFSTPNLDDCPYIWKYRVQFEEGYLWVEEDDLLELNEPTINLGV